VSLVPAGEPTTGEVLPGVRRSPGTDVRSVILSCCRAPSSAWSVGHRREAACCLTSVHRTRDLYPKHLAEKILTAHSDLEGEHKQVPVRGAGTGERGRSFRASIAERYSPSAAPLFQREPAVQVCFSGDTRITAQETCWPIYLAVPPRAISRKFRLLWLPMTLRGSPARRKVVTSNPSALSGAI
jgi:hypothetical protein